jgi:excisionase family DNA binding protein
MIKTLDLKEAAALLKMTPEGLRRKVTSGEIPGAKPGKCWVFCEDDIAEYLRSLYSIVAKESQGVIARRKTWRSIKEITPGGLTSLKVEKEYNAALELVTK